jgi:PTH1 family peptidyl-tRNA hydrolase
MGLFQNRPQVSDPINYVTVGMNKTILVVGLGNPGKEYDLTRHNVGFLCLDEFVTKNPDMDSWIEKKDLKCLMSSGRLGEVRVIAIKPTTFMNNSGEAVRAVCDFYKIHPTQIVVVHDELDINFGQLRTRMGGSSAGHNGIKSIIQHCGENFGRIRIGIGPKTPEQIEGADFVLGKFPKEQQAELPAMTREANAVLTEFIYGGQMAAETRSFLI